MTRLTAEHRRAQVVAAARSMSVEGGLYTWTLQDVAKHVGISPPAVRYYFESTLALRKRVIKDAIADKDVSIVLQAIATMDPLVKRIDPVLRNACALRVRNGHDKPQKPKRGCSNCGNEYTAMGESCCSVENCQKGSKWVRREP